MTNVRRIAAALTAALALGLTLFAAPAAQAFNQTPVLPVRTVCVRSKFRGTYKPLTFHGLLWRALRVKLAAFAVVAAYATSYYGSLPAPDVTIDMGAQPVSAMREVRAETHTIVKVLPSRHVFRSGDPIRVCFGSMTDQIMDSQAKLVLERKGVREGARWRAEFYVKADFNEVGCAIGVFQGVRDFRLRVRTLNGPSNLGSVSRVVRVEVTAQ